MKISDGRMPAPWGVWPFTVERGGISASLLGCPALHSQEQRERHLYAVVE